MEGPLDVASARGTRRHIRERQLATSGSCDDWLARLGCYEPESLPHWTNQGRPVQHNQCST